MFIRDIFRKFPFLLTANILLLLVRGLISAASIFMLIPVIDFLIKPRLEGASTITHKIIGIMRIFGLPVSLSWLLAIALLFNILKISVQIFTQYFVFKTKYAVLRNMILGAFEDFFNARWSFFTSNKQGTFINTFIREISVVGDAFGAMAVFFSGIIETILCIMVPFYISWQVTSISLATALFFALPFLWLGKTSYKLGKVNTATANHTGSVIQESLSLAKIILGFGNQRKSAEALSHAFDAHTQATIKSQTLEYAIPLLYYPFGLVVLIIGMLVAQRLKLPLSETAILLYTLLKGVPSMGELIARKNSLDTFFPSYEQVMNLRKQAKQLAQKTGAKIFTGFDNEIRIENLTFAYPGHEAILAGINIRIPKGKMIAIVGESGAGKSTLIDMIMGFHEPTAGRILFDEIPLEDFDIGIFRKRIGYVPQDSVLFNMTIRDNLLWAKEDATEDEIKQSCHQSNAEEFIQNFPKGYDTLVGDRGVRLSGGQIQRVALARAILRKPALLILDEATSALDTYSERLIQQAIENIAKEATVVVIAHRLSTIMNADYVYVLKEGRIVEEGIYSQLIQLNGQFNHMVQLQKLDDNDKVLMT